MNTDIRVAVSFRGHRKRKKLQRLLGADAVLCLIDLWLVAAMTKPDGVFVGMDAEDIAIEAGWDGDAREFVAALIAVGFVDDLGGGLYSLHDWDDHNSYASDVDVRSDKARMSKMRQSYPELWRHLRGAGIHAVTKESYQQYVGEYLAGKLPVVCGQVAGCSDDESTEINEYQGIGEQVSDAAATPQRCNSDQSASLSAQLAPSPSPSPSPSQKKDKNVLCDAAPLKLQARPRAAPGGAGRASTGKSYHAELFERFWDAFGDKRGREPAFRAWRKINGLDLVLAEAIVEGARRYAKQRPALIERKGTPKMAEGWLSDRRWEDETVMTPEGVVAADPELEAAFSSLGG